MTSTDSGIDTGVTIKFSGDTMFGENTFYYRDGINGGVLEDTILAQGGLYVGLDMGTVTIETFKGVWNGKLSDYAAGFSELDVHHVRPVWHEHVMDSSVSVIVYVSNVVEAAETLRQDLWNMLFYRVLPCGELIPENTIVLVS